MTGNTQFDVIIVGGSYSGLAAGMALGRSLRKVLIIDSGLPCNRQTPYSHNFITQDGVPPGEIAAIAKRQVEKYPTISFLNGLATRGVKVGNGFEIEVSTGEIFQGTKLVFATGISDILPGIPGYAECWGNTAVHCPYCHGYEIKNVKTGILGNGDSGFEYTLMIFNWTKDLTLFTNGRSLLTDHQKDELENLGVQIIQDEVEALQHNSGVLNAITMKDGSNIALNAIYYRPAFSQHCTIPQSLGCGLTEAGYIQADNLQRTTVPGVFACGDNASPMRTVANAVATGTAAGMAINKELILEK
jgi:thioredoxin reductase